MGLGGSVPGGVPLGVVPEGFMPVGKGEEVLFWFSTVEEPLGHGISDPLDTGGVMSCGSLWLFDFPWA